MVSCVSNVKRKIPAHPVVHGSMKRRILMVFALFVLVGGTALVRRALDAETPPPVSIRGR